MRHTFNVAVEPRSPEPPATLDDIALFNVHISDSEGRTLTMLNVDAGHVTEISGRAFSLWITDALGTLAYMLSEQITQRETPPDPELN